MTSEVTVYQIDRNKLNGKFLEIVLRFKEVLKYLNKKAVGHSGRKRIEINEFESFQIPLPPLEIQNKIAEEVKRRISKAERLKAEASRIIEEAKKKAEGMILGD